MAENFDTVPLHPERWTDKAPFLGQWLWVLFWLAVPQAMASLLMSSLFSSRRLSRLSDPHDQHGQRPSAFVGRVP